MGRKLDLSGLSDLEAAHVLQVVQRDMRLRKKEEERLSDLKQELDEEGSRCRLLSRQNCFNQRCCIRCCAPFTFLLNPKRRCGDCGYNVCRACRAYSKKHKGWLCSSCQKHRLLKTQSLEWFYTNVKKRFKRFGSAKVLKTLYKKHLTEHSILSELTDGSGYEESICNDGSICGSDSTFYRQSEEHTETETLTVARRVAEEAIDEAISKAETDTHCQEKQNEAHYLREHRGELIEELAKTIVQKIISRRKTLAEIKGEYDQDLTDTYYYHFAPSQQQGLWRSHSAFSLLDTDSHSVKRSPLHTLQKEGTGTSLSAWKSVDRLDNSVLKSPDGNWIALQSGQLSRPSLLTKRKSLVYSALERESGAVSAYEAMDCEIRAEPDSSWGAALKEIHKKMTQSQSDLLDDLDLDYAGSRRGSRDSEGNYWKSNKALINRKVPAEIRKPSSSRRTSIIDVNFNVEGGTAEEEETCANAETEERKVPRSRRKRRSKKETTASYVQDHCHKHSSHHSSDAATPETLTSGATTPDLNSDIAGPGANQINQELTIKLQHLAGQASFGDSREDDAGNNWFEYSNGDDMDVDEGDEKDETELDNEAKDRLYKLVAQSRLLYLSSTDDDLHRADVVSEEEDAQPSEDLKSKLCRLEQEVKSTQFSSTEDELDRLGLDEDERQQGEHEELAFKVCRLAKQVNAAQFSSTEDELDRVGIAEEAVDEAALWKLQAEKGARVRDLASLVSTCQFSSTEDELDRAGQDEEVKESVDFGRRESIGDLDVDMFELKGEERRLEDSFEQDARDGAGFIESKITSSTESENVNKESKNQEEQIEKEKVGERRDSNGTEPQTESDSQEDEEEFNRIINSMLLLTLEDMQMGDFEEKSGLCEEAVRDFDDNGVAKGGDEDRETGEEIKNVETGVNRREAVNKEMQTLTSKTDTTVEKYNKMQDSGEVLEAQMKEAEEESSNTNTGVGLEEVNLEQSGVTTDKEALLSPEEILKRYSAVSLRSITTEVLKVLNATEQLLQETQGEDAPKTSTTPLPQNTDPKKLDEQFSRLEENVYMAAGSVYGLEAELSDLEDCARAISSSTSHSELSFLEEQVATAAAKVQQSELQISDISARIAALRSAGLNVDPQPSFTKSRTAPAKSITLDSSRQQRRLLPAPPVKDDKET